MELQGKKITAVVSDVDGTLLRHGTRTLSDELLALVERLLEQGILFMAASGRQVPNLRKLFRPVADRIGYIAENGGVVVWQGETVYKAVLEETLAQELIVELSRVPDADLLVAGPNTCFVLDTAPAFGEKLRVRSGNQVALLHDFSEVSEEKIKISVWCHGDVPAETERYFHQKYDDRLLVVQSGDGWLDFTAKGTGKGEALRRLAEHAGFALGETAAFGDSENDIGMIGEVGAGYAMETGVPGARAAAGVLCASVEKVLEGALAADPQQERLAKAMQTLRDYVLTLARSSGQGEDYGAELWERIRGSEGVLRELAYYHDYGKFWDQYRVAGYSLTDVLVWQVDHFKAYLDRRDEVKRWEPDRLFLSALDVMLRMERDPAPYVEKMQGETGTDYLGKY